MTPAQWARVLRKAARDTGRQAAALGDAAFAYPEYEALADALDSMAGEAEKIAEETR